MDRSPPTLARPNAAVVIFALTALFGSTQFSLADDISCHEAAEAKSKADSDLFVKLQEREDYNRTSHDPVTAERMDSFHLKSIEIARYNLVVKNGEYTACLSRLSIIESSSFRITVFLLGCVGGFASSIFALWGRSIAGHSKETVPFKLIALGFCVSTFLGGLSALFLYSMYVFGLLSWLGVLSPTSPWMQILLGFGGGFAFEKVFRKLLEKD